MLAGFAGSARALGRSAHVMAFGALTTCALVVPVLRSTTDEALSTAFATGSTVLFGFVCVLVGFVAFDRIERELSGTA